MTILKNLNATLQQISDYERCYHRHPQSVKLLVATKKQSIDAIQQAIDAEQLIFGENQLQEALPKIDAFKNHQPPIEWHFIGPIQSNKTKKIAENFAWVHSVDSPKIAKRLNEQRPEHLPPLNICLEINISQEPSKSGIAIEEALSLALYCQTLPHIQLRGLMAIPAPKTNLEDQRIELRKLKNLFDELIVNNINLDTLSMGMSSDMEAAIAEGSTIVRIGTAIFRKR